MTNPLTFEFWSNEEQELWGKLSPLVMNSLLAGAKGGLEILPDAVADNVNWQEYDHNVQSFLLSYRLNELAGINATTMERVIEEILQWQTLGESQENLRERLLLFALSLARAEMIAVTEVTRLFGMGNILIWLATGLVAGKTWMTARDELVCPICAPLHGEIRGLLENFSGGINSPPIHPHCRCWISPRQFLIPILTGGLE